MGICKACGGDITEGATLCGACGAPIGGSIPNQQQPAQPQQTAQYQAPVSYNQNVNQNQQGFANGAVNNIPAGYQRKSRMAAGLLGVFFGSIGVGRFYLGYTKMGILQLVVTLVTFGVGSLWGFIDGIIILTGTPKVDGKGVPLI